MPGVTQKPPNPIAELEDDQLISEKMRPVRPGADAPGGFDFIKELCHIDELFPEEGHHRCNYANALDAIDRG